jgi:hypothetical protein
MYNAMSSEGVGLPMKKLGRLLALAVPLVFLAIPYHAAKASWIGGFNCFGETDCVNGWNTAISQAQTDWDSGLYSHSLSGGNFDCPGDSTTAECHGFVHGYIYEWTQLWQQYHIGGDNG